MSVPGGWLRCGGEVNLRAVYDQYHGDGENNVRK